MDPIQWMRSVCLLQAGSDVVWEVEVGAGFLARDEAARDERAEDPYGFVGALWECTQAAGVVVQRVGLFLQRAGKRARRKR